MPSPAPEMDKSRANSARAAEFVSDMRRKPLSDASLDAAKMCLVDWLAVCIGARGLPEAAVLRRYLDGAGVAGRSPLLIGGTAAPATAALVNGTLSHCLDYDDTHIPTALHASGPTWAALFALGAARNSDEASLLKAFVCGFEVGASLGSGGLGVRLNESGWHSTGVLGRISSATAAACLLGLDSAAIEDALGLAATQASGLTASFGTMAKPFHAGKAAMDGVIAAELAEAGLGASHALLDSAKGLFGTIFQDRKTIPSLAGLGTVSEIMRNSLKPYAACQLTHAPIDAARALRDKIGNGEVEAITVHVNPLAIEIAGVREPRTPMAGRFSTAYCVALALCGYPVSPDDFVDERLNDPKLVDLAGRVSLSGTPDVSRTAARLEARLTDGSRVLVNIEHAFGSEGNPMKWPQLETKFLSLVRPHLGAATTELYDALTHFEQAGAFSRSLSILSGLPEIRAEASQNRAVA